MQMHSTVYIALMVLADVSSQLLPDCRCHAFRSIHQKSGVFKSPNYKHLITPTFECIIYSFHAEPEEIVHITLIEFEITRGQNDKERCTNYVRIFSRIQHLVLNEHDPFDFELCGKLSELPQLQFFSGGRYLLMQLHFHSLSDGHLYGFLGEYRFEKQAQFVTQAVKLAGTVCDQIVISPKFAVSAHSLGYTIPSSITGRIQSPDYPQNYPSGVVCQYYFVGDKTERVMMNLVDLELAKSDRRVQSGAEGDLLKIDDATLNENGPHSTNFSNKNFTPLRTTTIIWHSDNKLVQQQFVSDGPHMIVTFVSNSDGRQNRGFSATYRFVNKNQVIPTNNLTSVLPEAISHRSDSVPSQVVESATYVNHISWYDGAREGSIQSIGFPSVYPRNVRQLFTFLAPTDSEIQINIAKFKLDSRQGSSCATHPGDKLDIYIGAVSSSNRWRSLCGTNLPVNLRTMNMRVPVLTIQFKSDNQTTAMENGFYLNYRIVSSHDAFSESSSKYEPLSDEWKQKEYTLPAEKEANQSLNNCTVVINSKGMEKKGTIIIPRQLGNANTAKSSASSIGDEEICHWTFLGRRNQRIRINLRPWSRDSMNPEIMEDGVAHKRTADRPYFRYSQTKSEKNKKLPHKSPTIRTIGCNSPYHLEIITFQNLSTSLPQFTERGHGSREWKLKDYEDDSATSLAFKDFNWIAGDRIKLCFQRDSNEELKNKAFMSSQLPRVDVVLKASFDEWLNDRHLSLQLPEQGEFYSVDYNFVTDFGVLAPFGRQQGLSCRFTFQSKISKSGNFSSPNYPGLYPVDTVCEYTLMGEKNEVISLRFLEFDIESSSSTCSTDEMGDYIELNPCSMLDFLNMPQVRYCQARPKNKEVPIRWNNPCLKVRFVSNEVIVRRGFLAHYRFDISDSPRLSTDVSMMVLTLGLVLFGYPC